MQLEELLKSDFRNKKIDQNLIFNFLNPSESAQFYNDQFSDEKGNVVLTGGDESYVNKGSGNEYEIMNNIVSYIKSTFAEDAIVVEIGGGVYQARSGNANSKIKNYFPLDISYSNIKRYTEKYSLPGIAADATMLPFIDNSIDCIFTHAFLEHPHYPEKVVSEISRVLKPNGIVIHNDAWFCRWWQRFGVVGIKKYSTMSLKEKLIFLLSKITEFKLLRMPPIIIRRILIELFQEKSTSLTLKYGKLKPNYNLFLFCDEDAASSIDPLNVIRFYEARGIELVDKLTFLERVFYKKQYIVLKKTALN